MSNVQVYHKKQAASPASCSTSLQGPPGESTFRSMCDQSTKLSMPGWSLANNRLCMVACIMVTGLPLLACQGSNALWQDVAVLANISSLWNPGAAGFPGSYYAAVGSFSGRSTAPSAHQIWQLDPTRRYNTNRL